MPDCAATLQVQLQVQVLPACGLEVPVAVQKQLCVQVSQVGTEIVSGRQDEGTRVSSPALMVAGEQGDEVVPGYPIFTHYVLRTLPAKCQSNLLNF